MVAWSSSFTVLRTTPWMPLIPASRILGEDQKNMVKDKSHGIQALQPVPSAGGGYSTIFAWLTTRIM